MSMNEYIIEKIKNNFNVNQKEAYLIYAKFLSLKKMDCLTNYLPADIDVDKIKKLKFGGNSYEL